jgi:hypothetical protein
MRVHVRRAVLVLLTVAATAACESAMAPSATSFARPRSDVDAVRYSGHALDYATSAGIANATVGIGAALFPSFVADGQATTDAAGSFAVMLRPGSYYAVVNGTFAGSINVTGTGSRGDFLARTGTCVARYGVVADSQTRRPIAGARVTLAGQTVSTDADGWYRVDLGCPANGLIGFNTTFISFAHPDYPGACQVVGRGVFGVTRLDMFLGRRSARPPCSFP